MGVQAFSCAQQWQGAGIEGGPGGWSWEQQLMGAAAGRGGLQTGSEWACWLAVHDVNNVYKV